MSEQTENLRRKNISELQNEESPLGVFCTNLPGEGRALLKLITKVRGPSDFDAGDIPEEGFPMSYFYAHPVEMDNKAGDDITRQTRVILIAKDLSTVSFVSQGVVSGMDLIVTHLGNGPWEPPLMVALKKKATKRGRTVYSLEVLD